MYAGGPDNGPRGDNGDRGSIIALSPTKHVVACTDATAITCEHFADVGFDQL